MIHLSFRELSNHRCFSVGVLFQLSVFFLCSNVLYASNSDNIKFERLSLEHGLSQSTITCIYQDSKGFLWFGTLDGLNKYDGYNFTVYYKNITDPYSISDDWITSIFEDRKGRMWIGTLSGGLNKFNRENERFSHYSIPLDGTLNKPEPHFLDSPFLFSLFNKNTITSVYEDKSGVLWVGTFGAGIFRFLPEAEEFKQFVPGSDNSKSTRANYVVTIYEDQNNFLWIGTFGGGLYKFDPQSGKFNRFSFSKSDPHSLSDNKVMSILEDEYGMLWIGTFGGGLNVFDWRTEKFSRYINQSTNPNSISGNNIVSICQDEEGDLWFGVFGIGLDKYDREQNKFIHYRHDPTNPNSLSDQTVWTIFEDRSGILWIGTIFGSGLNKYNRRSGNFIHIRNDPRSANCLNDNVVWAIHEDQSGILWIGTYTGGLNRYDRKTNTFKHYRYDASDPNSLSGNHIRAIMEDHTGILWVGTFDKGLNQFDRKRNRFIRYQHNPDIPGSLSDNRIRSIYEDKNSDLWIGTLGGGLNKFDRATKTFVKFKHSSSDLNSISDDRVYACLEDKSGTFWVGTFGGGLNRFDRQKNEFISYQYDPENINSLSNDRILSLHEDKSGALWIATYGSGINKFDRKSETFTRFNEKDGLPNDVIYGVLEDISGNLWISTNIGISKYNPQLNSFRNYDMNDGLQSNEFNAGAYFQSESGEMFFGGVNGFNSFFPEQIGDNQHIPSIVISAFRKFDEIIKREPKEITLSYKDNFFAIEFAALDYANPDKNEYAYKLEGFDKDWIYCGTRRTASYTNINPGEYIFSVKGSNDDAAWNEEGITMAIIITPPFWKTWWFQAIVIFSFLFSAVWWYRYRIGKIKKRSKVLELEVKEKTRGAIELEKALEYLSHPENPEQVKNIIDKLETGVTNESNNSFQLSYNDHLFLLINNELKFINVKAIWGINAAGDYTEIYTSDGKRGLTQKSMKEWEKRLPQSHFVRIHRSTIINMEYIDRLEEWYNYSYRVYMKGKKEPFIMSRRYVAKLKEKLG